MAALHSLGLHKPSALDHLVVENLLPKNADPALYTWEVSSDGGVEEELLITKTCVAWSQGRILRKLFNLSIEKQELQHAKLAWFPEELESHVDRLDESDPLPPVRRKSGTHHRDAGHFPTTARVTKTARALVVFLKHQAHVFFLSGPSHIINLPFEVERVFTAPKGLLLQRRLIKDSSSQMSLLGAPAPPQNSFFSSHLRLMPGRDAFPNVSDPSGPSMTSFGLDFNLLHNASVPVDDGLPRHYSFTNPMSEMALVVQPTTFDQPRAGGAKALLEALDLDEDLIYVSSTDETRVNDETISEPLGIVVTLNVKRKVYTLWHATYVSASAVSKLVSGLNSPFDGKHPRRRSSFVTTGTATPVARPRESFRESMGAVRNHAAAVEEETASKAAKRKPRVSKSVKREPSFAAQVEPEHERRNTARESRRVSSMFSRGDMSASFDRNAFQDLATQSGAQASLRQSARRGHSLGAADRQSTGSSVYRRLRASTPGTFSELSLDDAFEHGISYLKANESQVSVTVEDINPYIDSQPGVGHDDAIHQNPLHGLRKELIVHKFAELPALMPSPGLSHSSVHAESNEYSRPVVFTLASPVNSVGATNDGRRLFLMILNKSSGDLVQVEISIQNKTERSDGTARIISAALPSFRVVTRMNGIVDALALTSKDHDKVLLLKHDMSGQSCLYLYSPWSSSAPVRIASRRLRIFNPHDVKHTQPSPRRVGARRTTSPKTRITRLRSGGSTETVDIVSSDGKHHQMKLIIWPRSDDVKRLLKMCLSVLPLDIGDMLLNLWYNRNMAFRKHSDGEWHALVVSIFCLFLSCEDQRQARVSRRHLDNTETATHQSRRKTIERLQSNWNGNRCSGDAAWAWAQAFLASTIIDSATLSQSAEKRPSLDRLQEEQFSTGHISAARSFSQSREISDVMANLQTHKTTLLSRFPSLVTALHYFLEDHKLCDIRKKHSSQISQSLAPMIVQLARWLGWRQWDWKGSNYYALESIEQQYAFEDADLFYDKSICNPIFESPPSIHRWLEMVMTISSTPSFPNLHQLFTMSETPWLMTLESDLLPRISSINTLHNELRIGSKSFANRVQVSLRAGMTTRMLESLTSAVLITLKEAIAQVQASPPTSWALSLLNHVSRDDLTLIAGKDGVSSTDVHSNRPIIGEIAHDLHSISQNAENVELVTSFPNSDRIAVSRLIFDQDRRLTEAIHMIEPYRVAVAQCIPEQGWSDGQILEAQKEIHNWVMTRTFALAPGLGFVHFDSRTPLLSEKFNIHGYNTLCVMKPMNNTVSVDRSLFTEDKFAWAWFHSGVAAGLSIAKNAQGIDSSWIVFNRPAELNNRHAGLLLALGLNGHLKAMAKWLAFKYLTPKHAMTSIGLLLGLSASHIGTMDTLITRLLSVHISRMLPAGAAELNLSSLTQTAGLMGVGLLYHNTQHRRMSEVMLSEIENLDAEDTSGSGDLIRDESYRLAAGFALGIINLGQGADLRGLHDLRIVERLLTIAVGPKPVNVIHLMDQATAGATIALTLVFMKTNNKAVARKIDIPDTIPQFDFVRPDILLLRILATHLIMWDGIRADHKWILQNLPREYSSLSSLEAITSLTTRHMPFYNILAGLLWAVGLRNAGSGSEVVRDFLIGYLDQLIRICRLPAQRYDSQLTRNTVRNCQDLIALSCATVMAGTGDLILFRRLRSLHGRVNPDTPYGSHMAAHMAVGALFFGAGSYTFGTTNLAIASLVAAFYPAFPMEVNDNKAHLQAFRHLWTLAAEPRCLVARDIDTQRNITLDVLVLMRDGTTQIITAPRMLPDLTTIAKISTISSEFWPVVLDIADNPAHFQAFSKNQTIYVRKRPPHEAHTSTFTATLMAVHEARSSKANTSDWIFKLPVFKYFETSDYSMFIDADERGSTLLDMRSSAIDARLTLGLIAMKSWNQDELWGLRTLFKWADKQSLNGESELKFIRKEVLDMFKAILEKRARELHGNA